jgi:hypothetical protein
MNNTTKKKNDNQKKELVFDTFSELINDLKWFIVKA